MTLDVRSAVLDLQLAHRSVRKFAPGEVTGDQLRRWWRPPSRRRRRRTCSRGASSRCATRSARRGWRPRRRPAVRRRGAAAAGVGGRPGPGPPAGRPGGRLVDAADYLRRRSSASSTPPSPPRTPSSRPSRSGLGTVFVGAIRNHPDRVAAELGLPPHAVAAFGLAVGVPDPAERAGVKPRLPQAAVVHRERYDAAAADAHIPGTTSGSRRTTSATAARGGWSGRVLTRLAGPESMAGRHVLREHARRLGLPSR